MKEQHSALTRSTQAVIRDARSQDLLAESHVGIPRRVMWIDGVGGFQLLDRDEVMIGQAISGNQVDICVVGDLSRQSAAIRRSEGDYLLQPLQACRIDGRPLDRAQLLNDGNLIQLGDRVQMRFAKPNPLSGTAKITLESLHRFKPHMDGVLLLSDSCVIGPNPGSHVLCPHWTSELLMFRHGSNWFFRTLEPVEVDGQSKEGQIPLIAGMRLKGEDFSLSIE